MDIRLCPRCGHGQPPPAVACPHCSVPLELRDERWLIGQNLGNYRIERIIGSGGMGVVFGARHQTLLRDAAIKVLQPGLGSTSPETEGDSAGDAFVRRFQREARLLAALEHPAIVGIYDFDVSPYGFPFLVMPLLRGETLRAFADRHPHGLPPRFIAVIAEDLCAGLAHAHAQGIVHRDLKPENLFLSLEGGGVRARVLDFGIAHGGLRDATDRTATGVMMGTPMYLAPEQMRGEPVSPATDQYSAALLLAELLSGRAVRAGMSLTGILRRDGQAPLPPEALPPGIDAELAAALTRATQPVPTERFGDMHAFAQALPLPSPDRTGLAAAVCDSSQPATATRVEISSVSGTQVASPASHRISPTGLPPLSASPPTMAAPAPPQAIARKAPWRGPLLAFAALALLALGTLGWLHWRSQNTAMLATGDWLRERRQYALPGNIGVLASREDALVMRQPGGFSLFDPQSGQAAPGVALASGERLVGADENGNLWLLLRDGSLDILTPDGQRRHAVAASAPLANASAQSRWALARSGRWLARIDAARFAVFGLREEGASLRLQGAAEAHTQVVIGDSLFVIATPRRELAAYALEASSRKPDEPLWREPLAAFRANDLALDEALHRVALATEDGVLLRHASDGTSLPTVPGNISAVLWIGDGPRLLTATGRELSLWHWREGSFTHEQTLLGGAQWLFRDGDQLLAGSDTGFRRLDFGHAPVAVDTGVGQVWAIAGFDGRFYVGGSESVLAAVVPGTREEPLKRQVHAAGVPDLRIHEGHLISASDDRTLAVWKLPELDVLWRARGHEFLVNQIGLGASPWSASSDGQLRRWGWPELAPAQTIDLRSRIDPLLELHALWVSPDDAELLAGTWNGRLLRLSRQQDEWAIASAPFEAHVGYRLIDLPTIDAVLAIGLEPGRLTVYDRRSGLLHDLPRHAGAWHAACADETGSGVWLGNAGSIAHLTLSRAPEGPRFEATMRPLDASGFGNIGAIGLLPATQTRGVLLGIGSDQGQLRLLPAPEAQGEAPIRLVSGPGRKFVVVRE